MACGVDPKTVLTRWLDPEEAGPRLRWRAGNIRTPGATAAVELRLSGAPELASGDAGERLHGRIVIAPGIDHVERAFDCWKYGTLSERPYLEATLAEGSMHVLAQWVPHAADPDQVGDLVVSELERHFPGLGGLVTDRRVLTPALIERELGIAGRPRLPRRSRASTSSSRGARCWAWPATGSRCAASTCAAQAHTRAAASPARRARTRPARSSPTLER